MVGAHYFPTHMGRRINFNQISIEAIHIEDISHALSMVCRFGGHIPRHYSVAEHSLLVAELVPDEYKLAALLHDASEAYVGDMVAPLKRIENMKPYRLMEDMIHGFIEAKFDIELNSDVIKRADVQALFIEGRSFYGMDEVRDWGFHESILKWGETSSKDVLCYAPSPTKIKSQFMNAFLAYGGVK